ncbi:hypothetical protein [Micromonospora sp. NPDC005305]|uniref:hypothetical protein n=1 Tax=Micromonospora sp. NPDC005305 TaxID=3156875 RepID=UPI0033A3219A
MESRNPYLILGIPFGTGRAEANKAFARRMKSLPADAAEAETRKVDLTWALQRIDQGPRQPDAEVSLYRLPADPEAGSVDGSGVFAPPGEPCPIGDAAFVDALNQVRIAAARERLRQLLGYRSARTTPPTP